VMAVLLWLLIERTRLGSIVRAGVFDAEMTAGLGINIHRVFTGVFAFGVALAALSGVIAGPIQSAYPAMGSEILVRTLIVVVVGGLGSLEGALLGALIVGVVREAGIAFFPEIELAVLYLIAALVLLVRPAGLFGRA
jgi:branched-subunit amino acid ABC-type transport system permease component